MARETIASLRADNAALRSRLGRPSPPPTTEDARLVVDACAALRVTRGELAQRLGLADGSSLSRAATGGLSERTREALRAIVRSVGARKERGNVGAQEK